MCKYAFLIAACCLLGREVCADPITFNITTLTGFINGGFTGADFTGTGYSPSGDFISIGGSSGHATEGYSASPGEPIQEFVNFNLDLCSETGLCSEGGFADIGGQEYDIFLVRSSIAVTAHTDLTFDPSNLTYIVTGATAVGEYLAYCSGQPTCARGMLLADVVIDLPGYVTASFSFVHQDVYRSAGATFTSTPEPSGVALLLLGVGVVGAILWRKRLCGSMFS